MSDCFVSARLRDANVALGAVRTSETCAAAHKAHGLRAPAAHALGRALSAAALLRFVSPRLGTLSLQFLVEGPLRQVFADVTDAGEMRGYCRGNPEAHIDGTRPALGPLTKGGMLSVLRAPANGAYSRSAVALTDGDIDTDVSSFAESSEQVPTHLLCHVALRAGAVQLAGGIILQALPDARPGAFAELRARLTPEAMAAWMAATPDDPGAWLRALEPAAQPAAELSLRWSCRCTRERAVAAVKLMPTAELHEMMAQGETAHIHCDFCGKTYDVAPDALRSLL